MSDGHLPPQFRYGAENVCRLISLFFLFFMCNFVVVATKNNNKKIELLVIGQKCM